MIKRYLDGIDRALFEAGPGAAFFLALACAVWAVELKANLTSGIGGVYWVHLLVVGPLWSFLLLVLLRAAWLRLGRILGKGRTPASRSHER